MVNHLTKQTTVDSIATFYIRKKRDGNPTTLPMAGAR